MANRFPAPRPFRVLLCVLVVALMMGFAAPASGQATIGIPDLDIVLLIDESGSMWTDNDAPIAHGVGAGTPQPAGWAHPGWRIVMADMFANLLGKEQSGAHHRVGMVLFGTDAKVVKHLNEGEVQDDAKRLDLQKALDDNHKPMDWTDFPEALQLALDELTQYGRSGTNVKRAVVFLSDGHYEIHEGMTDAEIKEGNDRALNIIRSGFLGHHQLYTVALADAAKPDPNRVIYGTFLCEAAAAANGQCYEPALSSGQGAQEANARSLQEAYLKIILDLLGLPQQELPDPITSPKDVPFDIQDGLAQVIFTILKYDASLVASVVRPDGSTVKQGDTGVGIAESPLTKSFSIARPVAGKWTVRLIGNGKVTIIPIPFPKNLFKVERLVPGSVHPQGKPMEVVVRVLDTDQKTQSPAVFSGAVSLPDGSTVPLTLKPDGTSYAGRLDNTMQRGNYVLTFTGRHKDAEIKAEQVVNVVPAPWLKLLEPEPGKKYPVNLPVPVRAQLMFGDKPLTYPDTTDHVECLTRLMAPSGQALDSGQPRLGPNGIFSGTVKADSEGSYLLRTSLTLTKANGEKFEDLTESGVIASGLYLPPTATFTAAPTATPRPTSTPSATRTPVPPSVTPSPSPTPIPVVPPEPPSAGTVAGVAGGILALLGAGGAGWWWMTRPALSGTLVGSGETPYPLIGKRPVTIGSHPRAGICLQGQDILSKHAQVRAIGNPKHPQVEIRSLDPMGEVVVGGTAVTSAILQNGDTIRIGQEELKFEGLLDDDVTVDPNAIPMDSDPNKTDWNF